MDLQHFENKPAFQTWAPYSIWKVISEVRHGEAHLICLSPDFLGAYLWRCPIYGLNIRKGVKLSVFGVVLLAAQIFPTYLQHRVAPRATNI